MNNTLARVLIVDDDEDDYVITRDLLYDIKSWKFDLEWVATYDAALEAIGRRQHDVYLVDYHLGGRDGLEPMGEAVRNGCKGPIIFLTGQADYQVDIEAMETGAADFLIKRQIDATLLERSIRHSIQRKQAEETQSRLEEALRRANVDLERRIQERTAELRTINEQLQQEVSERKQLQEQFLRAQKMEAIGQLAGGVAHDFNNLLTPILAYTQMALDKLAPGDPLRIKLNEIEKAGERAANLTRQLLAFSRRQIVKPQVINLNELILNMDKMLRRVIGEDLELITLCNPKLGPVKVDPGQIEQILMNLAVNARDAMQDGGKLIIKTANSDVDDEVMRQDAETTAGEYVVLTVSDTGTGIPDEVKAHIFDPFFTTKEVGKGTGLGLSTCYGIVEQNGGYIHVDSEPGEGATFKIYLPRIQGAVELGFSPSDPGTLHRGGETVLLVEDDLSVKTAVAEMLSDSGYSVLEAANGVEAVGVALDWVGKEIHLLLTDVVMPLMGGKELARRFRALHPGASVLYTSGYMNDAILRQGIIEHDTEFIQNPLTPAVLTRKIREVLDQRSHNAI